ncbi:uncharacterized protein J4E78_000769 [Alternaria triticimaculans]|uniref:uncharacterized protein n=1 Tax=Alternaria triticimaculans TaxID=297637 RepID=UPI0020C3C9E6|nr:uncharacterized protein J4E78_000769 [Alternaria triticimaculans]KAI4672269.1 hypothetical protein J4E78_000769 [Alternaria triticimaculans]
MSSITPQSFVDDGGSFTKRTPRGLDHGHVAKWVTSNSSDTSAYTGSFIDDGADMHLPPGAAPGFGPIDTRFYNQRKRPQPKDGAGTMWNEDMQKAISGDIQRNLEKIRGLGGLEVKKSDRNQGTNETAGGRGEKKKDTVTIPMPPQWGTFVIKAEDGRVIIVDKDGEFDSGPQKAVSEQQRPWVKAASTIEPASPARPSFPPSPPKHCNSTRPSKEASGDSRKQKTKSEKKDKNKKSRQSHHSPPKALTPIPESDYEDGYLPYDGEDIGSPTGFMMTGGASGWPSSKPTSVASPAISVSDGYEYIAPGSPLKTISEGFRYVTPASRGYKQVVPKSDSWVEEKRSSPVRSLPGGWPSPELSPVKENREAGPERSWDGGQFEGAWKAASPSHSHKSDRSHRMSRSGNARTSKKDFDNGSVKSHSTYRAPTVEDAPSDSSREKEDHIATGWGGSVKSDVSHDWDANKKNSEENDKTAGWASPLNNPHPYTWGSTKSPSEKSWSNRPKAADNPAWTGIEPFTSQSVVNSPTTSRVGGLTRPSSNTAWDGFEISKGTSDAGVVGTDSERGSLGNQSRVSSQPPTHRSHRSHDTRTSHRSNRHGKTTGWEDAQAGWAGGSQTSYKSQNSHQPDAATGWPSSRAASQTSWDGEKAHVNYGDDWDDGDKGKGNFANGFDENNATYLNDNWGGIPVRVGSRAGSRASRQSGDGWE